MAHIIFKYQFQLSFTAAQKAYSFSLILFHILEAMISTLFSNYKIYFPNSDSSLMPIALKMQYQSTDNFHLLLKLYLPYQLDPCYTWPFYYDGEIIHPSVLVKSLYLYAESHQLLLLQNLPGDGKTHKGQSEDQEQHFITRSTGAEWPRGSGSQI